MSTEAATDPVSRTETEDNYAIRRQAEHDSAGALAIGLALAADPVTLSQVEKLSCKQGKRRRRFAADLAHGYIPRGCDTRDALAELLEHAATCMAAARRAKLTPEQQRCRATKVLCALGVHGYCVRGEASPGDPARNAKHGEEHHLARTLSLGAAFIVRRGTGRCMNLERDGAAGYSYEEPCRAKVHEGWYCPRCLAGDAEELERRHNRRVRIIKATLAHAPMLSPPRTAREERLRKLGQPGPGTVPVEQRNRAYEKLGYAPGEGGTRSQWAADRLERLRSAKA